MYKKITTTTLTLLINPSIINALISSTRDQSNYTSLLIPTIISRLQGKNDDDYDYDYDYFDDDDDDGGGGGLGTGETCSSNSNTNNSNDWSDSLDYDDDDDIYSFNSGCFKKDPFQQRKKRKGSRHNRRNNECQSGLCDDGVCLASETCQPLIHDLGMPFAEDHVVFVLVGSGFSLFDWENFVHDEFLLGFHDTNGVLPFHDEENTGLFSVFYVENEEQDSFCYYNCQGISQLLCCDVQRTKELTRRCFPPNNANTQTIVIHNDNRYGGAGYIDESIATASRNYWWPDIILHELGHSLFSLVDEYWYGVGDASWPNCDYSGCSKWSDLIGRSDITNQYGAVECKPGCKGSLYRMGFTSIMNEVDKPLGAVNTRFTCCTYLFLTGEFPAYCRIFEFSSRYLENYCQKDYQNMGFRFSKIHNQVGEERRITQNQSQSNSQTSKYVSIEDPMEVTLHLDTINMDIDVTLTHHTNIKKGELASYKGEIFPRNKVIGHHKTKKLHGGDDKFHGQIINLKVVYTTGETADFLISDQTRVKAPPQIPNDDGTPVEPGSLVEIGSDFLQFIIENGSLVKEILARFDR